MALIFEVIVVGVVFRLLAFALSILASLVGLALEAAVLTVRYVAWPLARCIGRQAGRALGGAGRRSVGSGGYGRGVARGLESQTAVMAGARAALAARRWS